MTIIFYYLVGGNEKKRPGVLIVDAIFFPVFFSFWLNMQVYNPKAPPGHLRDFWLKTI